MTLLRTRLNAPQVAGLRNLPFKPGDAIPFAYPVELRNEDLTVGLTIVSAKLAISSDFGQPAHLTKNITTTSSADGQITDDGATDGIGALHLDVVTGESTAWVTPQAFQVTATDSLGRSTLLDSGYLVPVTEGEASEYVPVDHVNISPLTITFSLGTSRQLIAVAADDQDNPLPKRVVTWASSDPAIATVDASGLVTSVALGIVQITASSNMVSASSTVTIVAPVVIVSDAVARGDSPTNPGSADTGQQWIAVDADWGVVSTALTFNGAGVYDKHLLVLEADAADCTVSVEAATVGAYGNRLALRATDEDNLLFVEWTGAEIKLVKREAGVDTTLGTPGSYTVVPSDAVAAAMAGPSFIIMVNGVPKTSGSSAFNQTVTRHGVAAQDGAAGSYRAFTVTLP